MKEPICIYWKIPMIHYSPYSVLYQHSYISSFTYIFYYRRKLITISVKPTWKRWFHASIYNSIIFILLWRHLLSNRSSKKTYMQLCNVVSTKQRYWYDHIQFYFNFAAIATNSACLWPPLLLLGLSAITYWD